MSEYLPSTQVDRIDVRFDVDSHREYLLVKFIDGQYIGYYRNDLIALFRGYGLRVVDQLPGVIK